MESYFAWLLIIETKSKKPGTGIGPVLSKVTSYLQKKLKYNPFILVAINTFFHFTKPSKYYTEVYDINSNILLDVIWRKWKNILNIMDVEWTIILIYSLNVIAMLFVLLVTSKARWEWNV